MSEPVTRKERYLAKISGENVTLPEKPITREEMYLAKIAEGTSGGETVDTYTKTEIDEKIENVNGEITAIEGKITTANEKIQAVETKVEETETGVEENTKSISENQKSITDFKTEVEKKGTETDTRLTALESNPVIKIGTESTFSTYKNGTHTINKRAVFLAGCSNTINSNDGNRSVTITPVISAKGIGTVLIFSSPVDGSVLSNTEIKDLVYYYIDMPTSPFPNTASDPTEEEKPSYE